MSLIEDLRSTRSFASDGRTAVRLADYQLVDMVHMEGQRFLDLIDDDKGFDKYDILAQLDEMMRLAKQLPDNFLRS